MKRIHIRVVEETYANDRQSMIHWFCEVFGFSTADNEWGIEEHILNVLARASYNNEGISSSQIKFNDIARSTVIYHLNRFIDAGLVVKKGRKYYLRGMELSRAIEEIEYDIEREMHKMIDRAKQFDTLYRQSMLAKPAKHGKR